ncbi:MAG TPA: DUF1592 domain-containing protein [Woeseiaceae bacterium]|nr:DUF1592 domain-containing protein [Woeseiaceae bacterium]
MRSSLQKYQQSAGYIIRGGMLGMLMGFVLAGCSPREPESEGTEPRVSLVTTDQYLGSLRYIFGPGIELQVEFPPFERRDGLLANSAAVAGISTAQLEQFQGAAASVASQVVDPEHRHFLIPCKPAAEDSADDACAAEFLSKTGRLLYRRPLSDSELTIFVESAASAADRLGNFYAGLEVALEAMLLSPEVLFVVERAEPDPGNPGQLRLDAYSLASRLSYFLWNAAPDAKLLDASASGELQTEDGRARAVDRMLASPRLADGMRAFFDDMFRFNEFRSVSKDPAIYPQFQNATAVAAREQTLRTVINHLLVKKEDYRDLFTTRSTFMTPALAILDEIPTPPGWVPYTFPPDSPRAGLLTQVSFLSLHAHPGRSSPTLRGAALRETLLCQVVPKPPPNVDFSGVNNPDSHYPTQRDRVMAHVENPSCAGCHKIMDPIGLALENFDGAGKFRLRENGALIDASGSLDGVEFEDALGLAQALKDNPALPECLVQRLFSYSVGGPADVNRQDGAFLDYVNEQFAAEGYRLHDLLRTIALSDAFVRIQEPRESAPTDHAAGSEERQVTLPPNALAKEIGLGG